METRLTWRPLEVEPDPVELAVCEVIRLTLPALFSEVPDEPRRFPRRTAPLPDGTEVVVQYAAMPAETPAFNGRDTLGYRLAGHAGTAAGARRFDGRAVVDIRTRAFFDLTVVFEEASASRG